MNENDTPDSAATPDISDTSDTPGIEADSDAAASAAVGTGADSGEAPTKLGGKAWRDIALYGLARLVLFFVLTVVIQLIAVMLGMGQSFPLAISALLALIIAFPLSMFVFKGLRRRVNGEIAVWDAGRQKHKDEMRAQLEERLD